MAPKDEVPGRLSPAPRRAVGVNQDLEDVGNPRPGRVARDPGAATPWASTHAAGGGVQVELNADGGGVRDVHRHRT